MRIALSPPVVEDREPLAETTNIDGAAKIVGVSPSTLKKKLLAREREYVALLVPTGTRSRTPASRRPLRLLRLPDAAAGLEPRDHLLSQRDERRASARARQSGSGHAGRHRAGGTPRAGGEAASPRCRCQRWRSTRWIVGTTGQPRPDPESRCGSQALMLAHPTPPRARAPSPAAEPAAAGPAPRARGAAAGRRPDRPRAPRAWPAPVLHSLAGPDAGTARPRSRLAPEPIHRDSAGGPRPRTTPGATAGRTRPDRSRSALRADKRRR